MAIKNDNVIDFIIGMPPKNPKDEWVKGRTNTVMENSMPQCTIYPGVPSFTEGISLFQRRALFSSNEKNKNRREPTYLDLLADQGFKLNQYPGQLTAKGGLKIAFQADSFPTDSFTNEYGENFLQSLTDVASEKAASILQITGNRNVGSAFNQAANSLEKSENPVVSAMGKGLTGAKNTLNDLISAFPGGQKVLGGANLVGALVAGSRIDFPMLWKSSGFQPSYTMTVRLYNPIPASPEMTKKYIIGPIAALMLLGIPISQDGKTYSWPFIHRIEAPGIYTLDPAFISNITIIKGGDQQQISYQQRMGVVDVRIDFGSLFNSILAGTKKTGRPTLRSYLDSLATEKAGVTKFSTTGNSQAERELRSAVKISGGLPSTTKNQAPTTAETTDEEKQNPPDRVSTAIKSVADSIINQIPKGFKILVD